MNRLRYMDEEIDALENRIVKSVGIYDATPDSSSSTEGLCIKTKDGKTHRIHHSRTCCEQVVVTLPEHIQKLHGRKILIIDVRTANNDIDPYHYEYLAQIKITDSLGEEYNIEFTAKTSGCYYSPYITAQREWIVCVFN